MFPVYKNKEYKQGKTDGPGWDKAAAFHAYIPPSLPLSFSLSVIRQKDNQHGTWPGWEIYTSAEHRMYPCYIRTSSPIFLRWRVQGVSDDFASWSVLQALTSVPPNPPPTPNPPQGLQSHQGAFGLILVSIFHLCRGFDFEEMGVEIVIATYTAPVWKTGQDDDPHPPTKKMKAVFFCFFSCLRRSWMLLGAAAEGAAPDVVPQLLDQLRVLLLDLLRKLLSPEKK